MPGNNKGHSSDMKIEIGRIFIIAEAGVNHNGDIHRAMALIDAAKLAGADAVKFQTFRANKIAARQAPKADYQMRTTGADETQYEMLSRLELDEDAHRRLFAYCGQVGIVFLSTAFDLGSLDLLERIGVPMHKVASGEITNRPLLEAIGRTGKPVIVSSGMCEIFEIKAAMEVLREAGSGEITVLQCNTEYPTPYGDVNLLAIGPMEEALGCRVGLSDHTIGVTVPIAAAALGVAIIEKHFTLDRNLPGPDHCASLEPEELKDMVDSIRIVELARGSGFKSPTTSESENRKIARKSIVAKRYIRAGESFSADNLDVKRPGHGINPMRWHEVIGVIASRDYVADEPIDL
jgi:N,N'-diacetyllegionaminate synthase